MVLIGRVKLLPLTLTVCAGTLSESPFSSPALTVKLAQPLMQMVGEPGSGELVQAPPPRVQHTPVAPRETHTAENVQSFTELEKSFHQEHL